MTMQVKMQMQQETQKIDSLKQSKTQRQKNLRLGFTLGSVAMVIFIGFMAKLVLLHG